MRKVVWGRRSYLAAAAGRWAVVVLAIASGTLNLVQAKKLGVLGTTTRGHLHVGMPAPPLTIRSVDGGLKQVSLLEPTILYYFSPQCAWCERNWANVKAIAEATKGRYRILGLAAAPNVEAYLAERHLNIEVYAGLSNDSVQAYDFAATPRTVVVEGGQIAYTWAGAYAGRLRGEVERAFGITLPGIH